LPEASRPRRAPAHDAAREARRAAAPRTFPQLGAEPAVKAEEDQQGADADAKSAAARPNAPARRRSEHQTHRRKGTATGDRMAGSAGAATPRGRAPPARRRRSASSSAGELAEVAKWPAATRPKANPARPEISYAARVAAENRASLEARCRPSPARIDWRYHGGAKSIIRPSSLIAGRWRAARFARCSAGHRRGIRSSPPAGGHFET
jgi:hypothetical protein